MKKPPRTPREHLRNPLVRLRYWALLLHTAILYSWLKLRGKLRA